MTINELYGRGSAAELLVVLAPGSFTVSVSQVSMPYGTRGLAEWRDPGSGNALVGMAKVDFYAQRCHFAVLDLEPAYRNRGIYTYLCSSLCDWLERKGVLWVTASPRNAYSSWVLQLAGFVVDDPQTGFLRYDVPGRDTRRRQFVDWKHGIAPEPAWHAALKASPPTADDTAGLPVADD
jgi:GNAT superfamily N-acetyltransferase